MPIEVEDTIDKCCVFGYLNDAEGNPYIRSFTIQLNKTTTYKGNIIIQNSLITVEPAVTDGYFEIDLIENTNMEVDTFYTFIIDGKESHLLVPNEANKSFIDLVPIR